jgi:hypothetical protein
MYQEMQLLRHLDVEQEYFEEENKNIADYLSSSLEHVELVVGKTNEDLVDIVME